MTVNLNAIRSHALWCAMANACTTAELAARALDESLEGARAALKLAAEAGYLRALLAPGLGNTLCYQPTPRAAGACGQPIPKFLRAGLSPEARWRGLLRGFVRFAARPELFYLASEDLAALCRCWGIPQRGYAHALVALNGGHSDIFVPILKKETPIAIIEAAADRWLPLLESGTATLHFIALAGEPAEVVRTALAALAPVADDCLRDELAALDAEIAADRTGLAALRFAARRAALMAELAATQADGANAYPWLGGLVEAVL